MRPALHVLLAAIFLIAQTASVVHPSPSSGDEGAGCVCCEAPSVHVAACCCVGPGDESDRTSCSCAAVPERPAPSSVVVMPPPAPFELQHVRVLLPCSVAGGSGDVARVGAPGCPPLARSHAPPPDHGPPRHLRFETFLI